MLTRFVVALPPAGQNVRLLETSKDRIQAAGRQASQPTSLESIQLRITDLDERRKYSDGLSARSAPA